MRRVNHKPIRTCLGCMRRDLKEAMVRIAEADGAMVSDRRAALGGRGGYLHPGEDCLARFVRSRTREFRSLRRTIDRAVRQQLADSILNRLDRNRRVE